MKARLERFEITRDQHAVALDRTDFLLTQGDRPLRDLLANAYVLGVIESAELMAPNPTEGR